MGSGLIEQAFGAGANQLASLWDFTITGASDDSPWSKIMMFEVEDVSLPFPKLTMEKLANGENYYSGIEFPNEVSLTLRETVDFTCLSYFEDWFDLVYDLKNRVFISYDGKTKGGSDDTIHRQGKLTFRTFNMSGDHSSETVFKKQFTRAYTDSILKQQEVNNILLGTARNTISSAQSIVTNFTRTLGVNLGSGYRVPMITTKIPVPVYKIGSMGSTPIYDANTGSWKEKGTYAFTLDNLSIIGVEDLSLSYSEGGPLLIKVNMVTENTSFAQVTS